MAVKGEEQEDIIIVEEQEPVVTGDIDSSDENDKEKEKPQVVQKKTPVRKRGNDTQKRMNELWMERKEAEDRANNEARVAAQERAKNSEYEKITASALEENLSTKRELLTDRLANAKDQAEVAKYTAELTKVEAQSAQIERYKIENQVQKQQPQQQQQQQIQQPREVSFDDFYEAMPPAGKSWIDQNREWYDPSSDNFNQEMAADITLYAQSLERNPGQTPPGTRAYFNKINDYIKQNWDDNTMHDDTQDDEEVSAPQQKRSYAAPVGNRNAQTQSTGQRKEYKISQSEKEMALSLDMKDKQGNSLSDNDKIRRFINLRESVPNDGPISMKTLKKGI